MPATSQRAGLFRLAAFLGIQRSFSDATHVLRPAFPEAVAATVESLLGEAVTDPVRSLARLRRERAARLVEPAAVVWLPGQAAVRLNAAAAGDATLDCVLEGPAGIREWRVASRALDPAPDSGALLPMPAIAAGYHTLHIKARHPGGRTRKASSLVIAAPKRAFRGPESRGWGVFLPLYALYSRRSWGIGDFSDLASLARWARAQGADEVALLPLLAAFLDGDGIFDPSPYAPASRLMWNEAFIDVEALPEFPLSDQARSTVASPAFQAELAAVRSDPLVDYARVGTLKASVLRLLSRTVSGARRRDLDAFLKARPLARDYARFRARTAAHGRHEGWPEASPQFDPDDEAYHAYCQFAAQAQLEAVASQPAGSGLYLDLPLGVHAAGYDVWRWPESFVQGASTGAPPDPLALGGQDWGFPPPHPAGIREQRYDYVIAYLRHSMRYAARLRIDHVMGLHRLFVIPRGFDAGHGVYLRYQAEELYAILCLESHLNRTELVGENLGTVPSYVNPALRRRGISGTYVLPFEVRPGDDPPLRPPRPDEAAALNTHDLLPFAAWWSDSEWARGPLTRLLEREGLVDGNGASPASVRDALLAHLGGSEARTVIAALEDLWLATARQNVPGANAEPNWRHKARLSLEAIQSDVPIARSLAALRGARRRSPGEGGASTT